MGVKTQPNRTVVQKEHIPPLNESQKATIVRALEDICNSKAFRTRKRCQQFLTYIVERTLEGQGEFLKERTLGVALYQRMPTYLTGEDSVVRVEAGEVRRRLTQYYTTESQSPVVRIEIPLGSYAPEFQWEEAQKRPQPAGNPGFPPALSSHLITIFLTALVMTGVFALFLNHKPVHPPSVVDQFWAPLFRTPQPVLICLPSPVVYQPSRDLYKQYSTVMEWWGTPLNLDPNEKVPWREMVPYANMYVLREDSNVAAQMLLVFDRIGKPSQVKSLTSVNIRDLRDSPAVLIGAFNNRWTMELTGNLIFTFEEGEFQTIRERGTQGRVWRADYEKNGKLKRDYAIVSRLIDSSTGQALFIAAGINPQGTEAAGELLSHSDFLTNALRSAPSGWQKMNFEGVLQNDVTDGVAGPPQIVAAHFW